VNQQLAEYGGILREAVSFFWKTRSNQAGKQKEAGGADQGSRSAVTGGAQMDQFVKLIARIACDAGLSEADIFQKKAIELPGYFRPTKQWDLLVVVQGKLVAAIELKSQVGPSFGNNFNNRTEEAIGSAVDLWTAFREGAFRCSPRPWLGYLFLLEDCVKSRAPVSVAEPHFEVFPEFRGASYAKRYELLCQRLVRERHYSAAAFLLSDKTNGLKGDYAEPSNELNFAAFAASLLGHVSGVAKLMSS
jgi:hypothetical protein